MTGDTPAGSAAAEVRPEGKPPLVTDLATPVSRATIVEVVLLDILGVLLTVAAGAVLILNEEADRWWWWVVGLASVLAVLTTVFLIQIAEQRRTFRKAAEEKAAQEAAERKAAEEKAAQGAAELKAAREEMQRQYDQENAEQEATRQAAREVAEREAAERALAEEKAAIRLRQASERLAEHLENLTGPLPDDLREWARKRRDTAEASGDFAVADRLTIALARHS
jgi:hypothetical protein